MSAISKDFTFSKHWYNKHHIQSIKVIFLLIFPASCFLLNAALDTQLYVWVSHLLIFLNLKKCHVPVNIIHILILIFGMWIMASWLSTDIFDMRGLIDSSMALQYICILKSVLTVDHGWPSSLDIMLIVDFLFLFYLLLQVSPLCEVNCGVVVLLSIFFPFLFIGVISCNFWFWNLAWVWKYIIIAEFATVTTS